VSTDPIFIVGYMHSGTSMLQSALGGHSQVYSSTGETKYFDFLPMTRSQFAKLANDEVLHALIELAASTIVHGLTLRNRPDLAPVLSPAEVAEIAVGLLARDHAVVFGAVMVHLMQRAGKQRWLEKTPTHIFSIDTIIKAIPEARFVEIVRDPRDVLASKKTRRATVWTTKRYAEDLRGLKHLEKAYDPLWDGLSWKSAARAGLVAERRYPTRLVRVRYEDLVRDPDRELRRICGALELPFEPSMVDVPAGQPASEQALGARGRGISSDSVGRWRTTLTASEVAVIQAVTAGELRALGYEAEPMTVAAGALAVPLLAHSGAEFFIRLRRRQQLGGTKFLSLVLGNYARRAARLLRG
jgi:hypothetical protein